MFGECEAGTRPCIFCNINYSRRPLLLTELEGARKEGIITSSPLSCGSNTPGEGPCGWSEDRLKGHRRGRPPGRGQTGKKRDGEQAGNRHNCCWLLLCNSCRQKMDSNSLFVCLFFNAIKTEQLTSVTFACVVSKQDIRVYKLSCSEPEATGLRIAGPRYPVA